MKTVLNILSLLYILFFLSCEKRQEMSNITTKTYHDLYDKLTAIMVHDVYSPPVASRIYAYPNIAAYEVIAQKNAKMKSLSEQLNGLEIDYLNTEEDYEDEIIDVKMAAIIAYLEVAKELVFSIDRVNSYSDSLYGIWNKENTVIFENSKKYAFNISGQIKNWIDKDNYKETRSMPDFNVYYEDESRWLPTPPSYMKGIEPHWSMIRPFFIDSSQQFRPEPHPEFSLEKDSPFYNELIEIYNKTNEISNEGNQGIPIEIARFWDCNPFVSVNRGHYMFAEKRLLLVHIGLGYAKLPVNKVI